ncbi:serine hydrolase [Maribacter cobaltidurans]|uniref:Serine hydrolase n=2 Tax=Maribacter cobaltidurans TaxID=1178778 RepID=A0A223VBI3_9FLAO|nr:serine hydrolase [Maribacter cobaltidurans]GGD82957.1 serine hydrolase [Maribacter cobaltidurans]
MNRFLYLSILSTVLFYGCSTDQINQEEEILDTTESESLYFPPLNSDTWETIAPSELNWNEEAIPELYTLLDDKGTKAFIILKDGKIVMEWYATDFDKDSAWYWASAGKTLTSFVTGIAIEEGYLELNDPTSEYLGAGWTSLPTEKENLINVWNQLTMTTGLDDTKGDCKTPDCLTYIANAGTRWGYHNAPYTLIQDVITNATGEDFELYFANTLKDKIGMSGTWLSSNGDNNVYWSTARSMARFGLLNLNNGIWEDTVILGNEEFLSDMKNTSQDLNKSYGYLWWLNGKESAMVPQSQIVFPTQLIPNAPSDLYAGLGKNDQKLYVIPSENMVVVRMGQDTGDAALGPSSFDNELWSYLNAIID